MNNILKLEELMMFAFSAAALYFIDVPWWIYILVLVGPDISMLGYLGGNVPGAFMYNLFHHKGLAILIFLAGWYFNREVLQITGIVLFGHASLDRVFGYGLKTVQGFKYTHLGIVGKK